MDNITPQTKTCSKCKKPFPATSEYFQPEKELKCGLRSCCKQCSAQYQRKYSQNHKKRLKEYRYDYNRTNSEHIAQRNREYYTNNRERYLTTMRAYYRIHKVKLLQYRKEYNRSNKEQCRIYTARRNARKLALPDTFTPAQWLGCLEYFNYSCAVCGSQLRDLFGDTVPHADHWIPLASEECTGTIASNMVCLCNHCNQSKSATMPKEWLSRHYSKKQASQILERIEDYFSQFKRLAKGKRL